MIDMNLLRQRALITTYDLERNGHGYMMRCVVVVLILIGSQAFDFVSRKALAAGDGVKNTRKVPAASALRLTLVTRTNVDLQPAFEDQTSGARSRAPGEIFAEDHVVDAALGIHERAMAMSPQDRFTFLAQWVLPNEAHTSLRLNLAFSPTYSSQAEGEPTTAGDTSSSNRGEIICPALDLLDTATQLNKLAVLRTAIKKIKPRKHLEAMPRLINGFARSKVTFTPWQTVASRWADRP